jgi:hypothetical protein
MADLTVAAGNLHICGQDKVRILSCIFSPRVPAFFKEYYEYIQIQMTSYMLEECSPRSINKMCCLSVSLMLLTCNGGWHAAKLASRKTGASNQGGEKRKKRYI